MTTDCEASDAEMLAAVERWAKATGRWRDDGPLAGRIYLEPHEVLMRSGAGGLAIRRWERGETGYGSIVDVAPHTALLWALSVEAGVTVDVGRCPACVARSLPGRKLATSEWWWTWERAGVGLVVVRHRMVRDGWVVEGRALRQGHPRGRRRAIVASRPCPDCNGSGRDIREAARLVLDAAARPWSEAPEVPFEPSVEPSGCVDEVIVTRPDGTREAWWPGDRQARDSLHVGADRRITTGIEREDVFHEESSGHHIARRGGCNVRVVERSQPCGTYVRLRWTEPDPLGQWIALWLAGKREGTADAVDRVHESAAVDERDEARLV